MWARKICHLGIIGILAACGTASLDAQSPEYLYKVVASSGDVIDGVTLRSVGHPSINDVGEVIFTFGTSFNGRNATGISTPKRVLIKPGRVIDGLTIEDVTGPPALNDLGEVAFVGFPAGGSGATGYAVFTLHRLVARSGQQLIGGKTIAIVGQPVLNNAGEIVFAARIASRSGLTGAIVTPDRILVQSGDIIAGREVGGLGGLSPGDGIRQLGINNAGRVAFTGPVVPGNGSAVFTQHTVVAQSGDVIHGKTILGVSGDPNPLAIDDRGELVFAAGFSDASTSQGFGIFTRSHLLVQSGDVVDGQQLRDVNSPSVNKHGELVFKGAFGDVPTQVGIFTPTTIVAQPGDVIGGKTIASGSIPFLEPAALNDYGQIAFAAAFTDGTGGVIVATPINHK